MPRLFTALTIAASLPAALACGGGSNDITGEPGPVASVTVSPTSRSLTYLDDTAQLIATAKDARGRVVPDIAFTWSSVDPSIIAVDANGLATAIGGGQTQVVATAAGVQGTASLTVTGPTDLAYLQANWTGEAVAHDENGSQTVGVAAAGSSVAGGRGTRFHLVVGEGADMRDLVMLGRIVGSGGVMGFADSYRGTFVVTTGAFDGEGSATFASGTRLGDGRVERVRMTAFRETGFDLLVDGSEDGGSTWTPVWEFHLEKSASAPSTPKVRASACSPARYAEFDFWLGNWNVTQGGSPSGTNRVDPLASMCGLQENWTDTGGGTGISLNMFDPRTEEWTQLWIDSGGGLLVLTGGLQGSAMVLQGTRGQSNIVDRVTWTPNADGSVRQHWETNTGGAGWVTAFDGLYRPRN